MPRGINPNFRAQVQFDRQKLSADFSSQINLNAGRLKVPTYGRGSSSLGEIREIRGKRMFGNEAGFLDLRIFNGKGLLTAMTLGAIATEIAYRLEVSPFVQDNIRDSYLSHEYIIPILIGAAVGIPFTMLTSLLFAEKMPPVKIQNTGEQPDSNPSFPTFANVTLDKPPAPVPVLAPAPIQAAAAPVSPPPALVIVSPSAIEASQPETVPERSVTPEPPTIQKDASVQVSIEMASESRSHLSLGSADIIVSNGYTHAREDEIRRAKMAMEDSIVAKVAASFDSVKFLERLKGDGKNYNRIPGHKQYRVLGPLGKGGMGMIYLAYDEQLKRYVVIKLPNNAKDKKIVGRFLQEAAALSRAGAKNNNIMQIFHLIEEPISFVGELIEGMTLNEFRRKNALTPAEALIVIMYILNALKVAHDQDVIHRDLKPANVMLSKEGTLKLVDFGLAKHLQEQSDNTQTGGIMGTPDYMAPENFRKGTKEVDHRADMYSIGILLYFLIIGDTPRQLNKLEPKEEMLEALHLANNLNEKAIPDYKDLPAPVIRFMERLTAKYPEQRFNTYAEALIEANHVFSEII